MIIFNCVAWWKSFRAFQRYWNRYWGQFFVKIFNENQFLTYGMEEKKKVWAQKFVKMLKNYKFFKNFGERYASFWVIKHSLPSIQPWRLYNIPKNPTEINQNTNRLHCQRQQIYSGIVQQYLHMLKNRFVGSITFFTIIFNIR